MKVATMQDFGGNRVHVSRDGIFSAVVDGITYEADTLVGLRDAVMFRTYKKPDKVEVPFTVIEDGQIRNGTALGIRGIDGHIQVLWADTDRLGFITWTHRALKRLGTGDADTYRRLCAARDAAIHAVERFERTHSINIKDEIAAALAADGEGKRTE